MRITVLYFVPAMYENYARHFKWSSLILVKIQNYVFAFTLYAWESKSKELTLSQDRTASNGRGQDSEAGLSDSRAWSLYGKGAQGEKKEKGAPVDWDLAGVAVLYHDEVLQGGYSCQSPERTSKKSPLTWGGRDCEIEVDQKCEIWVPEGSNKEKNRDIFKSGTETLQHYGRMPDGHQLWRGEGRTWGGGVLDFKRRVATLVFQGRWFKSGLSFPFPQLPEFLPLSS